MGAFDRRATTFRGNFNGVAAGTQQTDRSKASLSASDARRGLIGPCAP